MSQIISQLRIPKYSSFSFTKKFSLRNGAVGWGGGGGRDSKFWHLKNISFVLSVSDWPIIIIGPGGLLLVVAHLFAVPVSLLWVGLRKST